MAGEPPPAPTSGQRAFTSEELADMVKYQHAYEASAKYISTVNSMIDSLMGIL